MSDRLGAVRRLVVARDHGECVLGRPDLGIYAEVPEPGAVLVEALQAGATFAEATERASAAAGEAVDGPDFLDSLAGAGLLAEPDAPTALAGPGEPAAPAGGPAGARTIRWIEGVRPATARHLFGTVAWIGYALAGTVAAALLVLRPDLRPSYEDVWFLGDPALSVLCYAPIGIALAAAHEMWHWLAARAIGVPAVFRVSYRGFVVVFETDITQIAAVPRRRRYGPFLAGMAFDSTVLAVALVLRLAYRQEVLDMPPVVDRLLGLVVLGQSITVGWQVAAVFLRSDVYAVLANALRCNNLYRVTYLTARERLVPLTAPELAELVGAGTRDRSVARWFSVVYLAGMLAMFWFGLNVTLPALVAFGGWQVRSIAAGSVSTAAFWESVAATGYLVAACTLPVLLGRRERRLRRAGVLT